METTTPFDLNAELARWRQDLAASPALLGRDLDELEQHLRDSVAELAARGLTEAEAFLVARRRFGDGRVVRAEFERANPARVWDDRAVWMVVGVMLINVLSSLAHLTTSTAGLLLARAQDWALMQHPALVYRTTYAVALLLPVALLYLVFCRGWLAKGGERWQRTSRHPVRTAIRLGAAMALIQGGSSVIQYLQMTAAMDLRNQVAQGLGSLEVSWVGLAAMSLLWPAFWTVLLVWLLVRRSRTAVRLAA